MLQCEVGDMTPGQVLDRMQAITGRFMAKAIAAKAGLTSELAAMAEEPGFKALEAAQGALVETIVLESLGNMVKALENL